MASGTTIVTKDGKKVDGLSFAKNDPTTITSTGGVTQLIPRKMVKNQYNMKHSLMLSADQLGLSKQDVADLVAFLKSYK